MTERHEHILSGCSPAPLASYLKGLGLLRVLTQCDGNIKAAWRGESLHIYTCLSLNELQEHLLHHYVPTAILAPWNGGSGFYEKDNKAALQSIANSRAVRLAEYRHCLGLAAAVMNGRDRDASPKGAVKNELLLTMRSVLPDAALDWFDAAILLTGDEARFPPLLGTGGNDGRLDFTNNFMQRLLDLIDPTSGAPTANSVAWLDLALSGLPAPGLAKKAIGQFAPGQVGGPNATSGYEGSGSINPWDFVLMIEGALPFAAAAVRRGAQDGDGILSYPFTVRATAAGAGNLGPLDSASARGELWMPLWAQPASYAEIRALLAEGRVALGTRPARDALDFVRAVHRLGGYRGVDRFQRYGLLMRSGKAFLATPLERVQVSTDPQSDWMDDLEQGDWLSRFRRFTQSEHTANRFVSLRRRLEDLLFELARRAPSPARVQALLSLLGEIQGAISVSSKGREALRPVPRLSARWVQAADDGGPGYRIARALAGLRGIGDQALPLRAQWYPIHPRYNDWIDSACQARGTRNDPTCRLRLCHPRPAGLSAALADVLSRRLGLAERLDFHDKPMNSSSGVDLNDLGAFLTGDALDRQIGDLLPGLMLCEIPPDERQQAGDSVPPAAFGLCRLLLTPDATLRSLNLLPGDRPLKVPPQLLSRLISSQGHTAIEIAWRRLYASGLAPAMPLAACPTLPGVDPRRLAAALLIPLSYGATAALGRAVLKIPDAEDAA